MPIWLSHVVTVTDYLTTYYYELLKAICYQLLPITFLPVMVVIRSNYVVIDQESNGRNGSNGSNS